MAETTTRRFVQLRRQVAPLHETRLMLYRLPPRTHEWRTIRQAMGTEVEPPCELNTETLPGWRLVRFEILSCQGDPCVVAVWQRLRERVKAHEPQSEGA
jgi:hypothetical protein